jgi:hypothetical protein
LPALFYSSALAQTQVEKLGGQVYRLNFPAVPAMPVAGTAIFVLSVFSPPFSPAGTGFTLPPSGSYSATSSSAGVTFAPPTQGVVLTVPQLNSWIYALVDGRGFSLRAYGPSPLRIGLPAGSGYRIRYFGGGTYTGRIENVSVAAGAFTSVVGEPTLWTVTPDPSNATQVSAVQNYSLAFTMVDAGQIFTQTNSILLGSVQGLPVTRNPTGGAGADQIIPLGGDSYRLVYNLRAPAAPEILAYEVVGVPRAWWTDSNQPIYLYNIDRLRGDSPLQVAVTPGLTGLDLALSGVPANTSFVVVRLDGPSTLIRQTLSPSTLASGPVRFNVGAGGPYRVKVVAIGGNQLPSTVTAAGVASDIVVPAGQFAPVGVSLAPVQMVAAPGNPAVTKAHEPYTLSFNLTLPEGLLDSPLAARLIRDERLPPANGFGKDRSAPSAQSVTGGTYSLSFVMPPTFESADTDFTHQLELTLSTFDTPGKFPYVYAPNYHRNESAVVVRSSAHESPPASVYLASQLELGAGSNPSLQASATLGQVSAYRWTRNGATIEGALTSTLALTAGNPSSAGLYQAEASNAFGSATSAFSIVGVASTQKVIGPGTEILSDRFVAANNNTFDQISLAGVAATITADPQQITRISFVDLNDDIVQVEFSGAGSLSLWLDEASGPAAASRYNQPGVDYMKGHAAIVITGADETTNVSVFSVGSLTAVNQTLFKSDVSYDGIADIAFIAIASKNGKFGGIRTANSTYFATRGITGVYAPNVTFTGPVFLGDIHAFASAQPVLLLGAAGDVRIAGGNLRQDNGQPVGISGFTQLNLTAGVTSHNGPMPAQDSQGRLFMGVEDVTPLVATRQ